MPAGWTIQQITHCSVSLACSDSLPNRSSAAAVGEADVATSASIVKQARKAVVSSAASTAATITPLPTHITNRALTATAVSTTASIGAIKVTPVVPGKDQQDIPVLVATFGGGADY